MKKLVCLFFKKGRLHSCSTTGVNFLKVLFQLSLHFSRRTCGGPVNIGVDLRKRFKKTMVIHSFDTLETRRELEPKCIPQ